MRQVQLRDGDLLTALAAEVQGGESVTLVLGGSPVAQIVPFPQAGARVRNEWLHSSGWMS